MSDLYTRAVSVAIGVPEEQVTKKQRATAKNLCFVSMYRHAPTRTEEELFNELVDVIRMAISLGKLRRE